MVLPYLFQDLRNIHKWEDHVCVFLVVNTPLRSKHKSLKMETLLVFCIITYIGMIPSYPVFDIIPEKNENEVAQRRSGKDSRLDQIEIVVQGESISMNHHRYHHEKLRRKRLRKLFQRYLERRTSTSQT